MPHKTEADTCRQFVLPKLYASGWDDERIAEQRTFTDGRIVVAGSKVLRRPQKRADYLLRYRPDMTIAVVEAKPTYKTPADGLQQAKDYAQILGLKFAYATNGHGIVEFDFLTGREQELDAFPTPDELWTRLTRSTGLTPEAAQRAVFSPYVATVARVVVLAMPSGLKEQFHAGFERFHQTLMQVDKKAK